jgi:hypothetical protein
MTRHSRTFALLGALFALLLVPAAAQADFGIEPGSLKVEALNKDGTPDLRAGTHPYEFVVRFALNTESSGEPEGGQMRDAIAYLPAGLVGNPTAIPSCPPEDLESLVPTCPGDTQIGVLRATVKGGISARTALYNLTPPPGSAARLGFNLFGANVAQDASVLTGQDYRLKVGAFNIPVGINEATETVWGVPPEASHDAERECVKPEGHGTFTGCSSDITPGVFLTLPAGCSELETTLLVDSKLAPGIFTGQSATSRDGAGNPVSQTGCDAVPFSPRAGIQPTTTQASAPSGLGFNLELPNAGLNAPEGIAETEPETTEVVFPPGVTVNPSSAAGLAGCTLAQYESASLEDPGCPEASKIGTLTAKTPLLEEPIEGSVYLGTPHDNPFGSLIAVYFVARAGERGVLVKQAGEGRLDPTTGQISTTFEHLPPLPYSSLELNLKEGPRAPLMTPQTCGTYETVARFYPFSDPGAATERKAPFKITSGAEGGACVSSESAMRAHPTLEAGSTNPLGGEYSPFVFRVRRSDGEQRFSSIQATLPTGLLGRVAGVPYCPEAGIAQAASRTREGEGALEQASPSCPAASQVGTVNVSAGAGPQPYTVQGKAYLAGPDKGAPLSLEIITPAIAGPFDLGSVAVRTALYVDEVTSQIHAVSDPLPSILHGIPLDVRSISLQMDKPEFTLNPTNCSAKTVTGSVGLLTGQSAAVSNPFAVGGCKGLDFEPELKLTFSGQTKRTGNPATKAVLTQPAGENANLAGVQVILPKGMFIDQSHIGNSCTRVQFSSTPVAGEGCPANSVLGSAKVWTPLLEAPEEGKVYLRSNGGERELPDMVIALKGQIPLTLVGFIDSIGKKDAEIRRVRSRFQSVPDAPVSRFELKLAGGKKGLLENSKDLCKASDKARFDLTGQNGKTHDTEPKVQVACGKKGAGKKVKGGKK